MSVSRACQTLLYQYSRRPLHLESEVSNREWALKFEQLPFYYIDQQGVVKNPNEVIKMMNTAVEDYRVKHVVIDTVQYLIGSDGDTFQQQFLRQDRFIQAVRQFVNETKCHCTLVIHPRKEDITRLLSINSLYGGAKVSQEADNVLLLQDEANVPDITYPKRYVQVVKNRYDGQLGRMDLRFHRRTKTFSMNKEEESDATPTSKRTISTRNLFDDKLG